MRGLRPAPNRVRINDLLVGARDGFRRLLSSSSGSSLSGSTFVLYVVIACLLVATAGLMSGLTLGLLSLDTVDLEMILRGPESRQKKYARGIQPLMRNPHRLLVTLVVANAAAMEALPLVVDRLTSPVLSLVLSVTVVLLFGEIIPQAVCSRYGLAVGYYTQHIVRALLILLFPITWPVAKLLDFVIGSTHNTLYRRAELRSLMEIYHETHAQEGHNNAEFSLGELNVLKGALDLAHKAANRAMTPLGRVFMLDTNAVLDHATLSRIVESGFSRIPIHVPGSRGDIVGLLMVKELALVDPCRATPVADMVLRSAPRVFDDTSLQDLLDLFQTGRSHMVMLVDRPSPAALKGASAGLAPQGSAGNGGGRLAHVPEDEAASGGTVHDIAEDLRDALTAHLRTGQVVGVITMEDVIEELLQEEILDETDQQEAAGARVSGALLASLPPRLRDVLQRGFAVQRGKLAKPGGSGRTTAPKELESRPLVAGAGAPRAPLARASAPASDPGDPGEAPARGASMPRTVSSGRVRVVHTDPAEEAARHGISLSGSAAAAP